MEQILVKIISGVYGYDTGNAVIGKNTEDAPFWLEKEKAKRIIDLGIAVEVEPEKPNNHIQENEQEAVAEENTEAFDDDPALEFADVDLQNMTLQELREFAEPFGLTYKVGTKKEAFIQEIETVLQAMQKSDDMETPDFSSETDVKTV